MNLYRLTYLPNISSNNKTHLNYFEIRLGNKSNNSKPNQTNSRFHFTSRPSSLLHNKNQTNIVNMNQIYKTPRAKKPPITRYSYCDKTTVTPKENETSKSSNNIKKIPPTTIKKIKLNIGNYNPHHVHNMKECPLCHKTLESYRYTFHVGTHPSQILPWLYLGSYRNASDKEEIKLLNIKYVLNCAIECYSHYPKDIHYKHLKLCDHPSFNIMNYLDQAAAFIEEAKNANCNILIHCQLGISRSTSCLIAFFIKNLNYSALTALQYIKKKRRIVMPNYGFIEQLMRYEKKLKQI